MAAPVPPPTRQRHRQRWWAAQVSHSILWSPKSMTSPLSLASGSGRWMAGRARALRRVLGVAWSSICRAWLRSAARAGCADGESGPGSSRPIAQAVIRVPVGEYQKRSGRSKLCVNRRQEPLRMHRRQTRIHDQRRLGADEQSAVGGPVDVDA